MRNYLVFIICFIPLLLNAEVRFFNGTFEQALALSAREGKPIFVSFETNWCAPCNWMDRYSFSDAVLSDYLNSFYIPVKIDVDKMPGYQIKEKYRVNLLPTLLILNTRGGVLERREQAMEAEDLLWLLKKHNPSPYKPKSTAPSSYDYYYQAPRLYDDVGNLSSTVSYDIPKVYGLYEVDMKQVQYRGFSVQVGAFGQYENVVLEIERLKKELGNVKILVHFDQYNLRPIYKVLVGRFNNEKNAKSYLARIKNKGIDGMVKYLDEMQS